MFEVFFESNFMNLWSGMLKYLKNYNQIENEKIFVLSKKTIQDAIRHRRQETESILGEEDIFYALLSLINDTKYFSDVICILSQFYKQIRSRKQQEYLIEIFTSMLNNNCSILNNLAQQNPNNLITSVYHERGGNRSGYNSPRSMKNQNFQLCESQVYIQDLQKFNLNLGYLLYTISPIITTAIISKIFYVLSIKFHSPLKQKLLQVAKEFLNLSIGFSMETEDLRDWKMILFDIIYPARFPLIQIAVNYKEFFYPLLSLNNIKNTIFIKWKSEYNFSFNILACSSVWNIIQESYEPKRGRIRDIPPFIPSLQNGIEGYGTVYQNMSQFHSQSKADDMNVKKNFVFNYASTSKINEQQKRAMQQDIQQAIGSIMEDQDSVRSKENGIKQRLVPQSNPATPTSTLQKPKYPTISKMAYFLVDGIRLIKEKDLTSEYFLNQKIVIEKSVMMRNILELIFYITLFIVCFGYSQAFIEKFTDFQKITDDYLTLNFQQIPPAKYLPIWESTCKQFKIDLQNSPPSTLKSLEELSSSTPNDSNYKDLCKLNIWVESCGIQEMIDLFQIDCERLLSLIIIMNKLGVAPKVFFGLLTSLGLQLIHFIFYQTTIKKRFYKINFFDLIDCAITVLAALIVWHMDVYMNPSPYETGQLDQYDLKNNCAFLKNLMMFFFLLLWIRFFHFVRKTEKLGMIVKMFELMVKDLTWFLVILFLALSAFSMFFYIGYGYTYDEYNSLVQTFLSLFSAVFGNFSLDGKRQEAQVYLIIFLIIFNIIVLNLLIAILSNTYNLVQNHGNMEYSLILYNDYKNLKKNDTYGSTYYFPPPLNVINICFAPFIYLFPTQSTLINQISLHISYFVLMISFTSIFLILSIIMIIPSYILTFFQIIFNFNNSFTLRLFSRIILSFIWLVLGVPILITFVLINDLPLFIKTCYLPLNRQAIQKIFEIDHYEKVNITFLKNILRKIRQSTKKKSLLSLSCFNASVYTHIPNQSNYQSIVNPSPSFAIFANNIGGVSSNNQNVNNQIINYPKNDTNTQSSIAENTNLFFQGKSEQLIANNGQNFFNFQKQQQQAKNSIQQSQFKPQQLNEKIPKELIFANNNNTQISPITNPNISAIPAISGNINDPSYTIKVTPAPIIDHENKIVDSVPTTIDDTLNALKLINSSNSFGKPDDLPTPNPQINPQQYSFPFAKSYAGQQEFFHSNLGKSKRPQQKQQPQETQFSYLNNKYEKNYPILFQDPTQEDGQDYVQGVTEDEGDLLPKRSNSQAGQPTTDIISGKKITEMYFQEIFEQQRLQQLQTPFNSNQKKQQESTAPYPNLNLPTLGQQQKQDESGQGLWLELFIKRTCFQTNQLKYSMLLQYLLDAKKSIDIQTKYYKEKKQLDKQSELIALIDVAMGKRALQKYFQNQQSSNSK